MLRPPSLRAVFSAKTALRSRFRFRFQSTATITNAAESSKTDYIKKKSSFYSSIISSFILGGIVAQVLPLSSLAQLTISDRLPEPNTPEAENYKSKLEKRLQALPLYKSLISNTDYDSVRAWNYTDSNTLNETITSGTLSVPGGIAIKPVLFFNRKTKEAVAIVHVGEKLAGYPFLVHGGMLATILDEFLKRSSSFAFEMDPKDEYSPQLIKTKSIELQYRFPTLANNFIVVKTKMVDGKVDGRIETVHGRLLVKGLGDFEQRPIN